MSNPTVSVARSVSERFRELVAFEATETIQAGPIETTARVRFRKPDRVVIEYSSYRNPIAEADELIGGEVEYASDDLVAMTLTYDGTPTWHSSARSGVQLKRIGRTLYEPLPGYDAHADLGFLADLTRDFLIRDEGATSELGRPTQGLGLKPKRARENQLLKSISYPFERGHGVKICGRPHKGTKKRPCRCGLRRPAWTKTLTEKALNGYLITVHLIYTNFDPSGSWGHGGCANEG